jgi:ATP-dependent DNA helicase RecG
MGDVSPANLDWDRLQKALTVEAERGFNDLEGRQQRFSQFLYDRLNQPPAPLAAAERARWRSLAERYETYPDLGFAARQHLVAETRRTLYDSRRQWEQQTQPAASPSSRPTAAGAAQRSSVVRNRASHSPQNTIKAGQAPPSANNGNPPELDQPITYLKGMGPKNAERLAKLGLLTGPRSAALLSPRLHQLRPTGGHSRVATGGNGDPGGQGEAIELLQQSQKSQPHPARTGAGGRQGRFA